MLTDNQKKIVRMMVIASGSDDYASRVSKDDEYALSELSDYTARRLSELNCDLIAAKNHIDSLNEAINLFESI